MTRYFKILNENECHNDLQYHTGVIEDIVPFNHNAKDSCCSGGIYFTDAKNIFNFCSYGIWVREVTIPEDAQVVRDPEGDKWRASKVKLSERKPLWNIETFKLLLDAGANVHADNDYPLRFASRYGHTEVVKLLLEAGADVHVNNDYSLRWASEHGHTEVVKLLLEAGADVHANNDFPLCWASGNGHTEVVKLLLEAGANIHANNDEPLRFASEKGHTAICEFLLSNHANIKRLYE